MKIIFYLIFSMSLITSCQKGVGSSVDNPTQNNAKAETKLDVPYGTDTAQKIDIYLPANRSAQSTKSIVLIHGGGWNSGNKKDFASYIDTFKRRLPDYAIFNIGYRLATTDRIFPTQENDVNAAVKFIAAHAEEYGINKEKVALLGVSAGAHLALLQAYKYPETLKPQAVVDYFGPTDITEMYNKPWSPLIPYLMQLITGTTPSANPQTYQQSSPAFFVSAQSPATLILHGDKDNVVDISQSYLLKEKLVKAGVQNEMVVYPNEGHGWFGAKMSDSFDRIVSFLGKHVK